MVTDYTDSILKARAESEPESIDEDSVMSDDAAPFYTPQSMSIAASESHDSSTEYTPRTLSLAPSESNDESIEPNLASNPMDLVTPDPIPNPVELEEETEDAPMLDLSPGKEDQPHAYPNRSTEPEITAWSQSSFANFEEAEYSSSQQKLGDLAGYDNHEDAETYKP